MPSAEPGPQYIPRHLAVRSYRILNARLAYLVTRVNSLLQLVNCLKLDDFELLASGGRGDLHFVADFAIQKRAADGRSGGDKPLFDISLFAADQLVLDAYILLGIDDHDLGAESGSVGGDIGQVQHTQIAHAFL